MISYRIIILLIFLFLNLFCQNKEISLNEKENRLPEKVIANAKKERSADTENKETKGVNKNFSLEDFYKDNTELDKLSEEILNTISDEKKVGQMIVAAAGEYGKSNNEISELIKRGYVGGILLLKGSSGAFKQMVELFNSEGSKENNFPLMYSADAEPSLINKKISGVKKFAPTNSIKTVYEAREIANGICDVLNELKINQNYAPVCDFSYNKEIIGNRSFGNNEDELVMFAGEFIVKTQKKNIIATAKHFPGHGNVSGDSHKELVYINGDLKEVDVFKQMIDKGVISVMVGHIGIINNNKYGTNNRPASISRNIVTDLLKNELGFKGLVVSDAMNMGAVSKFESPSLNAIKAGCDMILMPLNEVKFINSVLIEMEKDKDFKKQVYSSVKKIVRAKICLGLFNN